MTDTVHYVGAVGGIWLALMSLWINFNQSEVVIITSLSMLVLRLLPINNKTWWVETVAFVGIYVGLLISNL